MKRDIGLTVCIPTYNRAGSVAGLVASILTCEHPGLQVVVLDNGSSDDTLARLKGISDPRLAVFGNGVNQGFLFNIIHVLDKGAGDYLLFCTDKDYIDPAAIPAFMVFLSGAPDIVAGLCEYRSTLALPYIRYAKGAPAVNHVAYQAHHPSGYFFKNDVLRPLELVSRYANADMVDMFPFDFVFGEMCMRGDAAIYHAPLITPERPEMAAKTKSFGTKSGAKDPFFAPRAKLKMAINFAVHAHGLGLKATEESVVIARIFLRGLSGATVGYKSILANPHLCEHYYIAPRQVTAAELAKEGVYFTWKFFAATTHLFGSPRAIAAIRLGLAVLRVIGAKLAQRLGTLQHKA